MDGKKFVKVLYQVNLIELVPNSWDVRWHTFYFLEPETTLNTNFQIFITFFPWDLAQMVKGMGDRKVPSSSPYEIRRTITI